VSEKMCDQCGEAPAVVHMKVIDEKSVRHLELCQRCATERGYEKGGSAGTIQDFSEKLVTMAKDVSGGRDAEAVRCSACGLLWSDFAKTGRLGCPSCYGAFMRQLKPILRKTHGSVSHAGRRPDEDENAREERRDLRRKRAELERAIRREAYEDAARLRDEIKELVEALRARAGEDAG
jgi:protein arginine kinase activator